jgi:hypothetical protein
MYISNIKRDNVLRIIHGGPPREALLNMAKIADSFGIECEWVGLRKSDRSWSKTQDEWRSFGKVILWDISTLENVFEIAEWLAIKQSFDTFPTKMLFVSKVGTSLGAKIIEILSGGEIVAIREFGERSSVKFLSTSVKLAAELENITFDRANRPVMAMELASGGVAESVMEFGEKEASLVFLQKNTSAYFFWTTSSIFDVERPLAKEIEFEEAIDQYIPAIIFIKFGFGKHSWHSPMIGADIIIDDPLLWKRYGMIDFEKLLSLATQKRFHVTVAFIPWNYWRTSKSAAKWFWKFRRWFGICAHGCDHSLGEFKSKHYSELLGRAHVAARHMDLMKEKTGMPWDRLMVCPREEFTEEALRAFADSNQYSGLLSSGCIPRDSEIKTVRGRNLLSPVQDAYFGFPIFKRHYWKDISAFALAAFLGKPAILVEHHEFFGDGCHALNGFLEQLRAVSGRVRWQGAGDLARTTFRCRLSFDGMYEIQFFADEFVLELPEARNSDAKLFRKVPDDVQIEAVEVGGRGVPFTREGGFVKFTGAVDANGALEVKIRRVPVLQSYTVPSGWRYNARVAVRRALSELRDRWFSRNRTLLKLANRVMRMVRLRN